VPIAPDPAWVQELRAALRRLGYSYPERTTLAELERHLRVTNGEPPLLPMATLRALRYAIVILPVDTLLVATKAMADFLAEVRRRDDVLALADRYFPFGEFNALIGATDQMALADRYQDA